MQKVPMHAVDGGCCRKELPCEIGAHADACTRVLALLHVWMLIVERMHAACNAFKFAFNIVLVIAADCGSNTF